MNREHVSKNQLFSLMFLFTVGTTLLLGTASPVRNDKWIAILISTAVAIPTILMYGKILSFYPGKNFFDILYIVFGKWFGAVAVALYVWYSFHLGALILHNFGEFVQTVALPETPMMVSLLMIGLISIWSVKEGLEVLSRTAVFFIPIIILVIAFIQIISIPQLNGEFLKPVLSEGWKPVFESAFNTFSFPFAENIVVFGIFCWQPGKKAPYKTLVLTTLFSSFIILIATFRNILTLGATLNQSPLYPTYIAVSRVSIGDYIQRMEVTVSLVFVIGSCIKNAVSLLATCNGIKRIFGLEDYRSVVFPVGILMIFLSFIIYYNALEMFKWAFEVYAYYALPFQVFIPLLVFILALWKKRKQDKSDAQQDPPANIDAPSTK